MPECRAASSALGTHVAVFRLVQRGKFSIALGSSEVLHARAGDVAILFDGAAHRYRAAPAHPRYNSQRFVPGRVQLKRLRVKRCRPMQAPMNKHLSSLRLSSTTRPVYVPHLCAFTEPALGRYREGVGPKEIWFARPL